MIVTLLGISAGLAVVGAIGAVRQDSWGLFFLFPAIGAVAVAPFAAGAVIVTMAMVEFISGTAIRGAYTAEAFWAAAMIVGLALGVLFAVIAVVASAQKEKA
jgi:hypothetical protein